MIKQIIISGITILFLTGCSQTFIDLQKKEIHNFLESDVIQNIYLLN